MEQTFRWFGPNSDPISLGDIKQAGASGIVTALHEIPNGEVWPVSDIQARKDLIEAAGLNWSVVESVPVHESIKRGTPERDHYIANYAQTLRNLAECGIDLVCYNFMPVLDWTRTDLAYRLPDGSWVLRFDAVAFAAFELFVLKRPGAENEYSVAEQQAALAYYEQLSSAEIDKLVATIIAGLPGAEESYTLDSLQRDIDAYAEIDRDRLRRHLAYFLRGIIGTAEEVGLRMAIHPDDPPRPILGLPRIMSTHSDVQWLLDAIPQEASGLTFCTGSYGVRPDNDLVNMARAFAPRIYFAHLRSVKREANPASFHEAAHLDGDFSMPLVMAELIREERRRAVQGGPRLPMRPDHGATLLYDQGLKVNPGYALLGRLKGLAELRGVQAALEAVLQP